MYLKFNLKAEKSVDSTSNPNAFQLSNAALTNNPRFIHKSATIPNNGIIKPVTAVDIIQMKVILDSWA